MDKSFEDLKYGDVVYCKAIGMAKKRCHFTVVISNTCTIALSKSSREEPFHHGITFSKYPSENGSIAIENKRLPEELISHWGLNVNKEGVSYFRFMEPVNFRKSDIEKICKEDVSSLQEFNSAVCDLLCSDIYVHYNMLKNTVKYGGIIFKMGELCYCENFGCNDANTVLLNGPSCVINRCAQPVDDEEAKELNEEVLCWVNYLSQAIWAYNPLLETLMNPIVEDEFNSAQHDIQYLIKEVSLANSRLEKLGSNNNICPLIVCPEHEKYINSSYFDLYKLNCNSL